MEIYKLLRKISLFHDLCDADLQKLLVIVKEVNFNKGEMIFEQGTIGDSLFAIKSGRVHVTRMGGKNFEEIASLSSGQHFGEMAILDDEMRSATVEATEPTQLIQIERKDLEHLLENQASLSSEFYKALAKALCRRLRQTTKDLASVKGVAKQITERLNLLDLYTGTY